MTDATANSSDMASRRTRRKPESLSKIKSAARKLFVERGYDATRPQDIAREAGLGHGTFYLHYPDKRACFLAFVEEAREEMDVHVRGAVAGVEMHVDVRVILARQFKYSPKLTALVGIVIGRGADHPCAAFQRLDQ